MEAGVPTDSQAAAHKRDCSENARTGLEADAITTALIDNLHCLDAKAVAYLSAEFLTGPNLGNSLISLGIWRTVEQVMSRVGQTLSNLVDNEEEPGLGNGGLGRLAACYMDSLATLNVPAIGYGIRYEFGIFDQA